eukprot:gnl/Trimastix_PCT/817.p1 GENE.gnl/Trimastix_PCT/817~~gnl/Trimastix_PCT/817.p1  ORF type:complete len:225 (+),score=30.08 gnl/Trimastix_PCT/817:49-675(+)
MSLERTLCLIKPDAVSGGNTDKLITILKDNGFHVVEQNTLHLGPERVHLFFKHLEAEPSFPNMVQFMSSAPLVVLVLSKVNAIEDLMQLAGPENSNEAREVAPYSIRALFGIDSTYNAVHVSDSPASARREINFFYPNTILDPIPNGDEARSYLAQHVNPVLTDALTLLCKTKPIDPITWLGQWLLENNPNKPRIYEPGEEEEENMGQ